MSCLDEENLSFVFSILHKFFKKYLINLASQFETIVLGKQCKQTTLKKIFSVDKHLNKYIACSKNKIQHY